MDKLQRLIKGKIPGEATGIEVRKSICTICDPHDPVRPRLLRQGRPHHQGGGLAREPAQRGHALREGRRSAAVGLQRGPAAHAAQAGRPAGLGRVRPHLLDRGARHHRREPAEAQGGERAGVGGLLLRLSQAAAALPAAARLPVRLAQLLHRVERLPHGHGHGLAPGLRPDGRPRPRQHQVPARVEQQPPPLRHSQRPQAHGRPRARREVHRGRPAQVAHGRHRRHAPAAAARHRRRPGPGHGQRHHLRGTVRPGSSSRSGPAASRSTRPTRPPSPWSGPSRSPGCRPRSSARPPLLYATTKPAAMHAQRRPGGAPHQRRAEPARRGRSGGAHRQLRRARRQRGPAARLAGVRRRRLHHPRAPVQDAPRSGATCRRGWAPSASRSGPR